jgi:uncharacterized repeat protein (TIGR01451 family)
MTFLIKRICGFVLLFVLVPVSATRIAGQDGPISVKYGDVYQRGELKIEPQDLATLPQLPAGYVALNSKGYLITTTASVSGPHSIRFRAASVGDEEAFRNLRIFHAEPDTYDPDAPVWVDRTILSPEDPAADFSNKMIQASCYDLGLFVIGRLVQKVPPSTAVADLVVSSSAANDTVVSPNNVSFTVKVTNQGPQKATDVGLVDGLSAGAIVSITPSQGRCKGIYGSVYCKLGDIEVGAAAIITIILKPNDGIISFSREAEIIGNNASARARETDPNVENNNFVGTVRVFPNPNLPPSVVLENPKMGDLFVGPAEINLTAIATDPDGTVSKVEFFDNGESIGLGSTTDGKHFSLNERNVAFGSHNLWAEVTDDGGRTDSCGAAIIIVNGSAKVSVATPAEGSLITPGSDLILTAAASQPSGAISKVEFFVNYELIGEGALHRSGKYTLAWRKLRRSNYLITAVVTDGAGITTTSAPLKIAVGRRPTVSIVNPSPDAHIPANQPEHQSADRSDGRSGRESRFLRERKVNRHRD